MLTSVRWTLRHGVDPNAGGERAEGGAQAGRGWDEHVADVERVGDLARVGGAGAAEGDQRECSLGSVPCSTVRIRIAFAMFSLQIRTMADGGLGLGVLERLPSRRAPAARARIERERPPRKKAGSSRPSTRFASVIVASVAAAAVAGRARDGAGALGTDLEEAAGVDPADRAAACADRPRRDARHADREAELELEVGRVVGLATE